MFRLSLWLLAPVLALAQDALLIEHVRLIDGSGAPPRENISILIEVGRISNVAAFGEIEPDAKTEVIDAGGKTVIPGIINLRGHLGMTRGLTQARENYTRENVLRQLGVYASFGVTTATSLGADLDAILHARDDIDAGNVPSAARVITALRGFTSKGGCPSREPGFSELIHQVRSAGDAQRRVDNLAGVGANLIHIWMDHRDESVAGLTPKIYRAIIRRATKHELRVSAQAPKLDDARRLVKAGVDILVQSITDRDVVSAFIDLLIANNVTYAPALVSEVATFEYGDRAPWLYDNFFKRSIGSGISPVLNGEELMRQALDPDRSRRIHQRDQAGRNLKTLADAGVRIGMATGSGLAGRFEGYFEHREAEMLGDAGLTPVEVIEAFSANSARALGIESDRGTLEAAKRADFVILNANPVDDIRNLREIHAVFVGGRLARL